MQKLNAMRKKVFLITAIAIGLIAIGFVLFVGMPAIGGPLFFIGIIISLISAGTIGSKFKLLYKEMICREVVEKLFDVEEYIPKKGFDATFVKETHFIPNGNRYSSDDYIRGSYKGCEFERSDVHMQNVSSNGKTTTTVTYFQGSWTIFTLPKKIATYMLIREKEFLSGGRPGGIFSSIPYTEKVKFEDIDFNNRFEVYAEDQHDAFYLITPVFMEKIKELEYMEDGRLIIGIKDEKVHVLFDNRCNAMEPSVWREVSEEDFKTVENEMRKIIRIMDILGLIPENEV